MTGMKIFALLSSVPLESEYILSCLHHVRSRMLAGRTLFQGKYDGRPVAVLNTGIGKVNAALCTTAIIETLSVGAVMNVGIAGAYLSSGLDVGDVAVATREIYGDEGVISERGWEDLRKTGFPLVQRGPKKYYNEFPAIPIGINGKGVKEMPFQLRAGTFVTVSAVSGTVARAEELAMRWKALCENMEGAAVSQVCRTYDIPFSEIRGMSNIAGIRDKRKWKIREAAENSQKVVLEALHSYDL